jgi:Skp family chaperone for outer membrane proteins
MQELHKSPLLVKGWYRGMKADEIRARLRIQAMERNLKRMSEEMMRTLASDPSPERTAALKAQYREFPALQLALTKERNAMLEKDAQRIKKKFRDAMVKVAALFGCVLLWLAWMFELP